MLSYEPDLMHTDEPNKSDMQGHDLIGNDEDKWDGSGMEDGWGGSGMEDGWGGSGMEDGWDGSGMEDGWGGSGMEDGWGGSGMEDGWGGSVEDSSDQLNKVELDYDIVRYFRKYLMMKRLAAYGGGRGGGR